MNDYKTIDNLGVDLSRHYAQKSGKTDQDLLSSSKQIPMKAQIDVRLPALKSSFNKMFGLNIRNLPLANFSLPKTLETLSFRLFGLHLLPAIRSEEFGITQQERIRARLRKKKPHGDKKAKEYNWEDEIKDKEEKQEAEILIHFIETMQTLDKNLVDINKFRSQYQRG